MRLTLLFPGQGAQRPGFLRRLPQHPAVDGTLAEAGRILEQDPSQLDDAVALQSTAAVQLGTLIAGVAVARALAAEGVTADAVAGLSVGAFAAAVACEALTFPDALSLVKLRGEAMARAAPHGHGMAAILGLTERNAQRLVAEVSERIPLYLAGVNSPTEVVVSGDDQALTAASEAAHAAGASLRRLRVGIPSHCPLMAGVSVSLREAMSRVRLNRPRMLYVSNTRARAAPEAADVAEDLILNVSQTVRWHDSVTLLYELGCRLYVESPPGQVLTHLVKATFPQARAMALDEVPLASAVMLAQRGPSA